MVVPYLVPAGLLHGEESLERVVGVVAPPLALVRVDHRVFERFDHDIALGGLEKARDSGNGGAAGGGGA